MRVIDGNSLVWTGTHWYGQERLQSDVSAAEKGCCISWPHVILDIDDKDQPAKVIISDCQVVGEVKF
jgi:hypothetical protein